MKIVFWQYALSIHQSAFIRSLANLPGNQVTLVVSQEMVERRIKSGWTKPDFGPTDIVVAPPDSEIRDLIKDSSRETIHILSGINSEETTRQAFRFATREECFIGFMNERSFGYPKVKRCLTWTRDSLQAPFVSKHISFFLAIGTLGVEWYKSVGYSPRILYPFGYFVERPALMVQKPLDEYDLDPPDIFRVFFIGSGIALKGIDILLKAIAKIEDRNWLLYLVGENTDENAYKNLCHKLDIIRHVRFCGALENNVVRQMLEHADLVVLPSYYDGWGAVVNEALMHGVSVICSDQCGAKDLLEEKWRGGVFSAGSVAELSQLMETWIARGKRTRAERLKIIDWAECITGERGAQYFLEIIKHARGERVNRPYPPWLTNQTS